MPIQRTRQNFCNPRRKWKLIDWKPKLEESGHPFVLSKDKFVCKPFIQFFSPTASEFFCLTNSPVAMYYFGALIKCSCKCWGSFWIFPLPRNSQKGPLLCSGHAGRLSELAWFVLSSAQTEKQRRCRWRPHGCVCAWLTPKHSLWTPQLSSSGTKGNLLELHYVASTLLRPNPVSTEIR